MIRSNLRASLSIVLDKIIIGSRIYKIIYNIYNIRLYCRDWVFGSYFCRVTAFMTHMSIVASVCLMAAIALERYMTIARPRSPHLSRKVVIMMS